MEETSIGFKYVLVIVDYFTKFVMAWPLKAKRANTVVEKLMQTYAIMGPPEYILTDNGSTISVNNL